MGVVRQIGTGTTSIEKFTKLILIRENVQATITITVFTRISAALDEAQPSNKRRIRDKKVNKHRTPMRRLLEEFRIARKNTITGVQACL